MNSSQNKQKNLLSTGYKVAIGMFILMALAFYGRTDVQSRFSAEETYVLSSGVVAWEEPGTPLDTDAPPTFNMTGGTLERNVATEELISDETVSQEFALEGSTGGRGGGIFVSIEGIANILEDAVIRDNVGQNGGGIYTEDASYQNLTIESDVEFADNTATDGWWIYDGINPPANSIGQIESRSMSAIAELPLNFSNDLRHPLNNNDINYRTQYTITVVYMEQRGDELIPLQVTDEQDHLTDKANVYEVIPTPVLRYDPEDDLIHVSHPESARLVSWIDGTFLEEDSNVYQADDPSSRPVLHHVHTNRTLTLVYVVPADGEEFFIITEEVYLISRGDRIGQGLLEGETRQLRVRGGSTYRGLPRTFAGYRYMGYRLDGRALRTQSPSIVNVRADHTVRMIYVDEAGGGIDIDVPPSPPYPDIEVTTPPPPIPPPPGPGDGGSGGSGGSNGGSSGGSDVGGSGGSQHTVQEDDQADQGNYEFIKLPNVMRVRPGQVVTYTFSDFGNHWGVPLEEYIIMDRPDKGLDIVAVRLPAFAQGRGVTYTIHYYTDRGGLRQNVLAENVPADQAFHIAVPRPLDGDFITMLAIEFGTVPRGFAVGDTFQMDFRVWDRPPARSLYNIGLLSYGIDGRYREFASDRESGRVTLGGWFASPLTGDEVLMRWYILMGLISISILVMCLKKLMFLSRIPFSKTLFF